MTTVNDIGHLFRTNYESMYRLAMLMLRDDNVSPDIEHDVFEAVLRSGMTEVSAAYLMTSVRNRCLKHIRSLTVKDRMKAVYSMDLEEIAEDWDRLQFGDMVDKPSTPKGSVSLQYSPNRHNSFSLSANYMSWLPSPSFKSGLRKRSHGPCGGSGLGLRVSPT